MKWKIKKEPKEGDFRCRRKFAWFPTEVGEYIVWWELYEVKEVYQMVALVDENIVHGKLEWVEVDRWDLCLYP